MKTAELFEDVSDALRERLGAVITPLKTKPSDKVSIQLDMPSHEFPTWNNGRIDMVRRGKPTLADDLDIIEASIRSLLKRSTPEFELKHTSLYPGGKKGVFYFCTKPAEFDAVIKAMGNNSTLSVHT